MFEWKNQHGHNYCAIFVSKMGTKRLRSYFDVMHRGDIMVWPVDQKRQMIIFCGAMVGNPVSNIGVVIAKDSKSGQMGKCTNGQVGKWASGQVVNLIV